MSPNSPYEILYIRVHNKPKNHIRIKNCNEFKKLYNFVNIVTYQNINFDKICDRLLLVQ